MYALYCDTESGFVRRTGYYESYCNDVGTAHLWKSLNGIKGYKTWADKEYTIYSVEVKVGKIIKEKGGDKECM